MYKNMCIYIYIRYVAGTVLLHSFPVHGDLLSRGRGVAAPGHLGSIGQEHKLAVATLAVPQCCARAQKALNFSNAVMEAAAPPVPLHILCSHFLEMLLYSPKSDS